MIIGYTSSIDKYRERTAASPPLVLRRKYCPCGKQATARQLAQYKVCVSCEKASKA